MNRDHVIPWALLTCLVPGLLLGCSEDLNLTDRNFACESDDDCLRGLICGSSGLCEATGASPAAIPAGPVTTPSEGACPRPPEAYRETLASGNGHVCAIREQRLYCWGDNSSGQLGIGLTTPNNATPNEALDGHRWRHVSAGSAHTCGVADTGTLYCWGKNSSGQLGNGSTQPETSPSPVAESVTWLTVTAGADMTCGITTAQDLYCWGATGGGKLGNGSWEGANELTPVAIGELGSRWVAVSLGLMHGCAIQEDGSLWCWAGTGRGENGNGKSSSNAPVQVGDAGCWRDVDLSMHGSLAMDADGELHGFGLDISRRLNQPEGSAEPCEEGEDMCLLAPTTIAEPGPWKALALGWWTAAAIKADGTLWGWGGNQDMEGPLGTQEASVFPALALSVDGAALPFEAVVSGQNHTCVRDAAGDVWCAGRNQLGQMGRGYAQGSATSFDRALLP